MMRKSNGQFVKTTIVQLAPQYGHGRSQVRSLRRAKARKKSYGPFPPRPVTAVSFKKS